ncbi:MAG: HlyC/CorC family transporter [Ignavibacteria bacterium]|nr:HlyC/CorC family transporter [Bacteroidota bacterium]MSQ45579.1 HlyC/CorC family transporter [Ignavibacteria bacterium]
MILQIIIIFLLILINGIFAMAEMAIVSSNKIRLQHLSNKGNRNAKVILQLISIPERFLSTVQIGITIVGLLTGAMGVTLLADDVNLIIKSIPFLNYYSIPISYFVVILIITFFSLVFGELVPKKLALQYSERIALALARPLLIIETFFKPMVNLLSGTTWFITKSLKLSASKEYPVTQEELSVLIDLGTKAGIFKKTEHDIVERALTLKNYKVSSFMLPRHEIIGIPINATKDSVLKIIQETQFSNYPVFEDSLDNISGIISVKQIFLENEIDQSFSIQKYISKPTFIPETASALEALNHFKNTHSHISFVVDEYGALQGLIFLNKIIENILGLFPVIQESQEDEIIKRIDGSYLMDGSVNIQKFLTTLKINSTMDEDNSGEFATLSGFIFSKLGKIPKSSDFFIWNDIKIEVVDMDGNRIDKVLITQISNKPNN